MSTSTQTRNARWVGRSFRLATGVGALALDYYSVRNAGTAWILPAAGWFAGLFAFYFIAHALIRRFAPNLNRWLGAIVANVPAVTLMFSGIGVAQIGALTYVGISTLVDAVNGDAGCEVMALPGLLTGQRTHLACIAFSPIDWLEARVIERFFGITQDSVA